MLAAPQIDRRAARAFNGEQPTRTVTATTACTFLTDPPHWIAAGHLTSYKPNLHIPALAAHLIASGFSASLAAKQFAICVGSAYEDFFPVLNCAEVMRVIALQHSFLKQAPESVSTSEAPAVDGLADVVKLDKSGAKRKAARYLINVVEGAFARRDLSTVNAWLLSLDPNSVSEWPSVGLIRSTARARRQLPAWGQALNRTREVLDGRGLPTRELLVGLLNLT